LRTEVSGRENARMSDDSPDEIVVVASVPNAPIAEMLVEELRNNGIEAFYRSSALPGSTAITGVTGPAGLCDIYVKQSDAERAQEIVAPV
jgi:hypothetical protein